MVTIDTITDEQIRELQHEALSDRSWSAGRAPRGRAAFLGFCQKALESKIYRGARAECVHVWNATRANERSIACPTCEVAAGIACTSMNRTGYKALRASHVERINAWNVMTLKTRAP